MKVKKLALALLFSLSLCPCFTSSGSCAESDTLTFPNETVKIEAEAFNGDTSLGKVVLNEKILEIQSKAFANSSITEVNLPASLTFIADDAFENSTLSLVTAVEGTYAFQWAVKNHYIDDSFKYSIHNGEYASIDGMNASASDVVVPEYIYCYDGIYPVAEISAYAFKDNKNIESVSLPSNLRIIGNGAFQNCTGLTQVMFSEQGQLEETGTAVFKGCTALEKFQ